MSFKHQSTYSPLQFLRLARVEMGEVCVNMHKIDRTLVQSETPGHPFISSTASIWNCIGMLSSFTKPALIQQTRCGYASQSYWHQILFETGPEILCWHPVWHLFKMKVTKGRLSLRTTADCKEQTRCLGSLALLSKESMMVGKVQTLPTAQHELHCRSLLCSILAKSVAPCLCRVHGRCSGDPRLVVFKNPGVLKRSDFICLHSKQFLGLPAKPLQRKG